MNRRSFFTACGAVAGAACLKPRPGGIAQVGTMRASGDIAVLSGCVYHRVRVEVVDLRGNRIYFRETLTPLLTDFGMPQTANA